MTFFKEIIEPVIDPNNFINATKFEALNYINTIPRNLVLQIALIVLPLALWFLYGLGTGKSKKMRLSRGNYWIFFILILIQIIILFLYNFPLETFLFVVD